MYFVKLSNAAAHKLTVTNTATGLFSLIDTAAGAAQNLRGDLNAALITVESGDIRVTFDGNSPTASNGLLLTQGTTISFANVPLTKMKLIRTGSANVSISVEVGLSDKGESTVFSSDQLQVGSGILTADITGTPITSPASVTTTETTINVPTNAKVLVAWSSAAWRVSEQAAMTQHAVVAANQTVNIPLGKSSAIYVRGDAGTVTLNFYFITV